MLNFSEIVTGRELEEVGQDEVLDFLIKITNGNKQSTKRNRYSTLSSFYNFTINTASPDLTNHCVTPIIKKIFRRPTCIQWKIIDKETIDEIIFTTMKIRNRIILELMARGGMRIGEVLKLTPRDIEDRKLIIQEPKSGRESEAVYLPRKLLRRLNDYVNDNEISATQRIFPISYVAA
ncbi:MAG: site-specific integrase [Pseudomonadota bacterium]|nr:site-specific integrase [Pseudomonadota bacterium]